MNGECYENRNRCLDDSVIAGEQFLARTKSVVSRTVAGETLIVPVRGKVGDLASIYSFNETGSMIWKLLETPATLPDIVKAIAEEFDVKPQQAECDATRFVDEMLSVGLVEVPKLSGTEGPVGREGLIAAGAK